jgi:hypothetical protein
MRKLKGLWLIGLGLFLLVLWDALVVWLAYAINESPETPVITVFVSSFREAFINIFTRFTIWSLWPISGFALVAVGLFRLVRSLFEADEDDNSA